MPKAINNLIQFGKKRKNTLILIEVFSFDGMGTYYRAIGGSELLGGGHNYMPKKFGELLGREDEKIRLTYDFRLLKSGAKKIGHVFCSADQKISLLVLKWITKGQVNLFQALK